MNSPAVSVTQDASQLLYIFSIWAEPTAFCKMMCQIQKPPSPTLWWFALFDIFTPDLFLHKRLVSTGDNMVALPPGPENKAFARIVKCHDRRGEQWKASTASAGRAAALLRGQMAERKNWKNASTLISSFSRHVCAAPFHAERDKRQGRKRRYPSGPGESRQVINCRCQTLSLTRHSLLTGVQPLKGEEVRHGAVERHHQVIT